jgi:hypothetical protein
MLMHGDDVMRVGARRFREPLGMGGEVFGEAPVFGLAMDCGDLARHRFGVLGVGLRLRFYEGGFGGFRGRRDVVLGYRRGARDKPKTQACSTNEEDRSDQPMHVLPPIPHRSSRQACSLILATNIAT